MNKIHEVTINLVGNKISQEDKRAVITSILLVSNRVFMESKIGPADTCKIYGTPIHFLLPIIKANSMMKTMKFETLDAEDGINQIKVSRTINEKKNKIETNEKSASKKPDGKKINHNKPRLNNRPEHIQVKPLKKFEHTVLVKFLAKPDTQQVIESDFFNKKGNISDNIVKKIEKIKYNFTPGTVLIPNNSRGEMFKYWNHIKLQDGVVYREASMTERIRWEKKRMMNEVKSFSGLGGNG